MALDPDDLVAIKNLLAEQAGEWDKALPGLVSKQVTAALGDVDARIAAALPKADPKGKKAKGDDVDLGDSVADEVAKLRKMVEAREKALAEAEAQAKQERLQGAARDALAKAGVPADRLPVAMAFLRDRLAYDGEAIGMKAMDRFGTETVQGFDEAIPAFLKTTEGKLFLPASGSQGTGTGAGRPAPRTTEGKTDWSQLKQGMFAAIARGDA